MALNRGKLSDVHQVGAGTSVGIVTVTSNKKIYVKSIICHAAGTGINTATAQGITVLQVLRVDQQIKSLMLIFHQEKQYY